MFSDLSEEEFLDIYGNKETENDHPIVARSSRRSQTNENPQERWEEDPERVTQLGMDIGDYEFIDKLIHCPAVNWVEQGKILKQVKN